MALRLASDTIYLVDPKHPNTFGANKRPIHTIISAHAMRDGRRAIGY